LTYKTVLLILPPSKRNALSNQKKAQKMDADASGPAEADGTPVVAAAKDITDIIAEAQTPGRKFQTEAAEAETQGQTWPIETAEFGVLPVASELSSGAKTALESAAQPLADEKEDI